MTKNKLLLFFLTLCLVGCRFSYKNIEFERAENSVKKKSFSKAVKHFDRVISRDPEAALSIDAARRAAMISLLETKQYYSAIKFFQHLVLYSPDPLERYESQERIAFIFFEKINDYQKAIRAYSRLLFLPKPNEKKVEYRFNIAKAHYYLNEFNQSLIELDELLKNVNLVEQKEFEVRTFKAGVLIAKKEIEAAIEIYDYVLVKFPDFSKKENVGISIAVAYEDLNDYERAIDILKEIKLTYPDPQFIDIKIKRLQQRLANLPKLKRRSR